MSTSKGIITALHSARLNGLAKFLIALLKLLQVELLALSDFVKGSTTEYNDTGVTSNIDTNTSMMNTNRLLSWPAALSKFKPSQRISFW